MDPEAYISAPIVPHQGDISLHAARKERSLRFAIGEGLRREIEACDFVGEALTATNAEFGDVRNFKLGGKEGGGEVGEGCVESGVGG